METEVTLSLYFAAALSAVKIAEHLGLFIKEKISPSTQAVAVLQLPPEVHAALVDTHDRVKDMSADILSGMRDCEIRLGTKVDGVSGRVVDVAAALDRVIDSLGDISDDLHDDRTKH